MNILDVEKRRAGATTSSTHVPSNLPRSPAMRPLPLVVNMFAGPGAGKSTLAAMCFGEIKAIGSPVSAELVVEFAKDLVWEGRHSALSNQAFVLGEQLQRIERVAGKVDVVITDSPVLMSAIYCPSHYPQSFIDFAIWAYRRFPAFDVFVDRHNAAYETVGRYHTEQEAREIDIKILRFLEEHGVAPLYRAQPTREHAKEIVTRVLERLMQEKAA